MEQVNSDPRIKYELELFTEMSGRKYVTPLHCGSLSLQDSGLRNEGMRKVLDSVRLLGQRGEGLTTKASR